MLLASPDARADNTSFVDQMRIAGYVGADRALLQWGYQVCQLEARGIPKSLIASKIVMSTGSGIYTADAYEIIGIANDELCYSGAASQA